MSVYRFLPLNECDALSQVQTPNSTGESCAIIGENSLLLGSLLFQAALSVASEGDLVLFLCPGPMPEPFCHVTGMTKHPPFHLQCIKMVYLSSPADLLRYLCEFHIHGCLPAAIFIHDIHFYTSGFPQEHSREVSLVKLFAVLEDTTAFISQKKGGTCHRMVSLQRGFCPANHIRRYFKELWSVSSERTGEFLLTDCHVPAFRAHLLLDEENREIVVDKFYRLSVSSDSISGESCAVNNNETKSCS